MKLEEQLDKLAAIGIRLDDSASIDDLLRSWSRQEYEGQPFGTLMFMLGGELESEPWGRHFSNVAQTLDMECIDDAGSYEAVIAEFNRLAGAEVLTDVKDTVDITQSTGQLEYSVDGRRRDLPVAIENDWADPDVITQILEDVESQTPGRQFYAIDNGQAAIWYLITEEQAEALRELGVKLNGEL